MYPPFDALIHLGPLTLHWYGVIMTIAIFLGALVASRYVESRGQDPTVLWDMLLWILIPAIIGARLYYVFIQAPRNDAPGGLGDYLANPIKIVQIWNGGIHIYGALIFGALALYLYARWRKLPLFIYMDGIGLGVLLGQCIGRLGNFMNQELYGPPTTLPWGLRIDQAHRISQYSDMVLYPDSTRFHPLFLYEMSWDGLGFLVLLLIALRGRKFLRTGDLALLYLIWAPLGRFFIEFLRTDSWFFPGTPFNSVHILTGGAVLLSALALIVRHRMAPVVTQEQPLDPIEKQAAKTGDFTDEERATDVSDLADEGRAADATSAVAASVADVPISAIPGTREVRDDSIVESVSSVENRDDRADLDTLRSGSSER